MFCASHTSDLLSIPPWSSSSVPGTMRRLGPGLEPHTGLCGRIKCPADLQACSWGCWVPQSRGHFPLKLFAASAFVGGQRRKRPTNSEARRFPRRPLTWGRALARDQAPGNRQTKLENAGGENRARTPCSLTPRAGTESWRSPDSFLEEFEISRGLACGEAGKTSNPRPGFLSRYC